MAALKKSLKPNAVVKRDGKWANIDAALLVPGDLVGLNAGAAVPADCRVNKGRIEVDQAALTGTLSPSCPQEWACVDCGSEQLPQPAQASLCL